MANVKRAVLVYCLLGALLQGCSHTEPAARDFTQVNQRPEKATESGNTLAGGRGRLQVGDREQGHCLHHRHFFPLPQGFG